MSIAQSKLNPIAKNKAVGAVLQTLSISGVKNFSVK